MNIASSIELGRLGRIACIPLRHIVRLFNDLLKNELVYKDYVLTEKELSTVPNYITEMTRFYKQEIIKQGYITYYGLHLGFLVYPQKSILIRASFTLQSTNTTARVFEPFEKNLIVKVEDVRDYLKDSFVNKQMFTNEVKKLIHRLQTHTENEDN